MSKYRFQFESDKAAFRALQKLASQTLPVHGFAADPAVYAGATYAGLQAGLAQLTDRRSVDSLHASALNGDSMARGRTVLWWLDAWARFAFRPDAIPMLLTVRGGAGSFALGFETPVLDDLLLALDAGVTSEYAQALADAGIRDFTGIVEAYEAGVPPEYFARL